MTTTLQQCNDKGDTATMTPQQCDNKGDTMMVMTKLQ